MASIEFCLTDKPSADNTEWGDFTLAGTDLKLKRCFFPEIQSHECCVSVNEDNDTILTLLNSGNDYPCFLFSMNKPSSGIDYCGISLIPPETTANLLSDWKDKVPAELSALLERAVSEDKYIVMLGL